MTSAVAFLAERALFAAWELREENSFILTAPFSHYTKKAHNAFIDFCNLGLPAFVYNECLVTQPAVIIQFVCDGHAVIILSRAQSCCGFAVITLVSPRPCGVLGDGVISDGKASESCAAVAGDNDLSIVGDIALADNIEDEAVVIAVSFCNGLVDCQSAGLCNDLVALIAVHLIGNVVAINFIGQIDIGVMIWNNVSADFTYPIVSISFVVYGASPVASAAVILLCFASVQKTDALTLEPSGV